MSTSQPHTHIPHGVCMHGFYNSQCPICYKLDGECDYGSCADTATSRVGHWFASRPMCERHADFAVRSLGYWHE